VLLIDCADPAERARGLAAATSAVKRGDLVVLPTDTVYGVGTDAFSARGVAAVRTAKGRGDDLPLPVMVGRPRTVDGLVAGLSAQARALIEAFWPGPLTIVARQQPTLAWDLGPPGPTGPVVAVRMPLHPVALELLRETGPMVVTGANVAGMPPPTTCAEAQRQLGEEVLVYLDGGPGLDATPSGVVDVTGPDPVLVRPGGFTVDVLREVCPGLRVPGEDGGPA
jgi:L-threonylcarbamoyladenylate synthase